MNRYRGFTLIELIITVAIASIVLAVGVPSFQTMMRNNRVATYTNEFMNALSFARSEAVKRGRTVTLCPSNSNWTDCASPVTNHWEGGWIIFVDVDGDATVDAADTIIRIHEALRGTITLQGARNFITYGNTGTTAQNDTLVLSLCNGNNQQSNIIISNTGRARISKETPTAISCTY